MCDVSERIIKLRNSALNAVIPGTRSSEGQLLWYRGWLEGEECSSNIVRRAHAKAYIHRNSTPVIGMEELIVGKPNYRVLTDDELKELQHYENDTGKALPNLQGQGSHMAIDYEKLLTLGIEGIKDEIYNYRKALDLANPTEMKKDEFYKACVIALEGVTTYASKYSDLAREKALQCRDEKRRSELLEISRILSIVPAKPASTFHEALQSIHFITVCLEGLYTYGRPDRYLLPYYRNDIKKGVLTAGYAQELVDCLCLMYNEYVPKGSSIGFMVGGKDISGNDMTNELTYMFIDSIGHTRLIFPAIGLCYNSDTPDDLLLKSMHLLAEGLSHPAIFNDDVIIKGLMQYGLPYCEACNYVHSTCVEITPIASSGVWVASPYHNLVQILLDILYIPPLSDGGTKIMSEEPDILKDYDKFITYEDLKQAYKVKLSEKIRQGVVEENLKQMGRCLYGGDPLVSCFVNDCLSKGMDIDEGGARYNWIMPSFVGLANLVDSLMAIKKLVFDQKTISLQKLALALENDFIGYESFRQLIVNKVPKYGNDDREVDSIPGEISSWIIEEVKKYKSFHGGCFVPSLFCWIMHERLGGLTEASPDGRKRAFPLGDGSGPAQGREMKGPTASILSTTNWSHEPFIGGIAVNMKFTRDYFSEDNLLKIASLIKVFISRGGFELQINVVDNEILLAAKKNPEAYQDLIVRVGGYSDYFSHLSPAMQDEVILRTTHG